MSATISDSIHDLAAGYALGALTPEETREFEAALRQSPELAREVPEYREVNALLALSDGPTPRAELKSQLLHRLGAEKVVPLSSRSRTAPMLAALLAAVVIIGGGLAFRIRNLTDRLEDKERELASTEKQLARREETLNTLLTAQAELTVVLLKTTGENAPGIQFFWNRKANTAVAHAFRLPTAPKGKAYQLWVMKDGKPVPGPVFNSDSEGHALILTFALPPGVRLVGCPPEGPV